jgi:hypothetical protein
MEPQGLRPELLKILDEMPPFKVEKSDSSISDVLFLIALLATFLILF